MAENADDEILTHGADDHDAVDPDRYAAVAVDHRETIIYDQRVEEAWIQSDAVDPLEEWV